MINVWGGKNDEELEGSRRTQKAEASHDTARAHLHLGSHNIQHENI